MKSPNPRLVIKISQYAFIVAFQINLNENNIYCIVYGFGNRTFNWHFNIESPTASISSNGYDEAQYDE